MMSPSRALFIGVCLLLLPGSHTLGFQLRDFIVAKDSTGTHRTIQEAVTACRDYSELPYTIRIRKGLYREKLLIPAYKNNIRITGEEVNATIITWDDYSGKTDSLSGRKFNTFTTYTCQVAGNNITMENLTLVNAAGPVGQAVALHVEGDRCVFRNLRLIGNQDTHLASGQNSRQLYDRCYIEGTTDFIFGAATAVFDHCTIVSKKDSYITAASTLPSRDHGFVFLNCRLLADSTGRQVYLGRPWRMYAAVTFLNCFMEAHIRPEGWHNWSKLEAEATARYAEYGSTGPGGSSAARVKWSRQLTREEAVRLTVRNILAGDDQWNPEQ